VSAISAVKRKLHRDIVASPVLHARVLNLYLCGEAYPHAVDDYFPIEHVSCPELAQKMTIHLQDEDKHVALYTKAIHKLGQEVIDLPDDCIFNHVIRTHTPQPWKVEATQSADQKSDKVANFLAHAHWLEKRIEQSLEFHLDACAHSAVDYPSKAVAAVLSDESRHVSYTFEAIFDVLPRARATAIIEEHRLAEKRANLDFSAGQLRRLLAEESTHWPSARKPFYAACSYAMRGLLHYA
jgi:hypothetical protein